MSEGFVAYQGDHDIHDGQVASVEHTGDVVRVVIDAANGRRLLIEFSEVSSVKQESAEGMTLYALSEFVAPAPLRRFVFANWDEAAGAKLEVLARGFHCREMPE